MLPQPQPRKSTPLTAARLAPCRPLRIGIEAQMLLCPHRPGMDIVARELIRNLQQLDRTNDYVVFVKPDEDNTVLRATPCFRIVEIAGGPHPLWEQGLLLCAARQVRQVGQPAAPATPPTGPDQLLVKDILSAKTHYLTPRC